MTDRYAVIGNPVAHSKSPRIHAEFARQTRQDLRYDALLAPLDQLENEVRLFAQSGGRGLNVTLPFKHRAYEMAHERSERAKSAGAVNTLSFDGGRIAGDNTDGVGLIRDITANLGFDLAGRRILMMGAGGAAYGVCAPLLAAAPASLTVANRTLERAERLREHFARLDPRGAAIRAVPYSALDGLEFDLVVNATSAGLADAMPPLPPSIFGGGALAYDMVYGKTPFLDFARARSVRAADGLGMLVEQAAESFYVWRGVRPETAPVIAMLRSA